MNRRSREAYASTVRTGLRRELRRYAEDVVRHRTSDEFPELTIRIWLVTAFTLELEHKDIRRQVQRQLREDLNGAKLADIYYHVDRGTNAPDFTVYIEPPPQAVHPVEDPVGYAPASQGWIVLVLTYFDYHAPFHLAPSREWIPFGRGVAVTPGLVPVRIADRVNAVPRGALLRVRRHGDRILIRRSELGTKYAVLVDSEILDPGHITEAAAEGRITYLGHRGDETELHYRLVLEA